MNSDILKLSKHVQYMAKPILKFNIFELETLLISCELDIPGVIALHGFLMKNHYPVENTITQHLSYKIKIFKISFVHFPQTKFILQDLLKAIPISYTDSNHVSLGF